MLRLYDNGPNYVYNEDSDEVSKADKDECPAKKKKVSMNSRNYSSPDHSTETGHL